MSLIISGGDIGELHAQLQQPPGSVMAIPASSFVQAGLTSGVGQVKIEGATSFIQGEPGEPHYKHPKFDFDEEVNVDQSMKVLFSVNKAVCLRVEAIESKLATVLLKMRVLEEKMDSLINLSRHHSTMPGSSRRGAVIVGLPQNGPKVETVEPGMSAENIQSLGPNVTLITLNTEDDFPCGTWLGDESNPEMRVRVPIISSDILHVHSNCRTPEKMALTLLDYLFDRDTQADSNLSGLGKHGKKQLDPLMIYGVRCHLIHRFGIAENDWHRIKQNIDSKCRTAWRRRQRGMPLMVKAFRGKSTCSYINNNIVTDMSGSEEESASQDGELQIHHASIDLQAAVAMASDASQHGEIQILHATPEQISQLQQAQHIQILSGDQVIGQIQQGEITLPEGCHVTTVTTDTGEVLQLTDSPMVSVGGDFVE